MHTEKYMRVKAISSAREALVEKAAKKPQEVLAGMIAEPEYVGGFSYATLVDVTEALLERGYRQQLMKLCDSTRLETWARNLITEMSFCYGDTTQ